MEGCGLPQDLLHLGAAGCYIQQRTILRAEANLRDSFMSQW